MRFLTSRQYRELEQGHRELAKRVAKLQSLDKKILRDERLFALDEAACLVRNLRHDYTYTLEEIAQLIERLKEKP